MEFSPLATPCGLFCGFCRYYMNEECGGCGSADREGCTIRTCCRVEKHLHFCTECEDFPCAKLESSVGLDPRWLEDLAQLPLRKWS